MTPSRDLFANFERMRREMDELFGDVFERSTGLRGRGFSPPVDVYYVDDPPRAVVKADLAGVAVEEVALEIHGRQLLIAGERRPALAGGRVYQQIEIEHGPFRRVVELGAVVHAELAGVDIDEIGLEIEGRELVLAGHRRPTDSDGRVYQQLEIDFGPFRRTIPLGADVVADQAKATYRDGILRVELPLVEPEKRIRQVPIEVEG